MAGTSWRTLLPELGQRTQLMGVLNLSPDSFSDGGRYTELEAAIAAAESMKAAGADLLDLGGETTRPGSEPVTLEVELGRVLPVLEALHRRGLGPFSIDTTKSEVARRALEAGAHAINDISAMQFDPIMAETVAGAGVPVVLMHTRAAPKHMQEGTWSYPGGVVVGVRAELVEAVRRATEAGIDAAQIALDPGIGFGKTVHENLELIDGLRELVALGHPVLVGPSRKSFLGALTGRAVGERAFATAASVTWAVLRGASMVRVHDVKDMRDVLRVADALRAIRGSES